MMIIFVVLVDRWRKLLASLRKTRVDDAGAGAGAGAGGGGGNGGAAGLAASYRLKHSHNCSNSELRVGVSNMKGYKKANQDRSAMFSLSLLSLPYVWHSRPHIFHTENSTLVKFFFWQNAALHCYSEKNKQINSVARWPASLACYTQCT